MPVIQPPPSGITAHSGRYLAWLGGYHNADDQLFQNVTIPTDLTSGILSFWYWSQSSETATGRDYFTLQLLNPATGHHDVDAFLIDGAPPTNGWRFASYTLTSDQVNAIRGQTVRVRFRVVTNGTLLSSFFVDDVSFQINGSVTPTPTWTPTTSGPTPTWTPTTSGPTPTRTPTASGPTPTRTPTPTPTASNGPQPGFWRTSGGAVEFYVTNDRAYVDDFAIYILSLIHI